MQDSQLWRKRARTAVELRREAEALRLLGPAAVRLVAVEDDVLVLENVRPGTPAARLPDDEATAAVALALPALWVPVPARCALPTVEQECSLLADTHVTADLPGELVLGARSALARLLRDPPDDRVLHGDLHPGNLLRSAARGWVAIDPHGLVGDPGYDVGPLLINPWNAGAGALLSRRLPLLAELLDMPVERLADWGLVRAMLAEAWHVQDTGHPAGGALDVARLLTRLQ